MGRPKYLSPTQVSMYLRCPRQYMYRYIEGLKEPPGVALIEGSVHHKCLEQNNLHKMKTGEDKPSSEMIEMFADLFHDQAPSIADWGQDREDVVIHRGRRMQEKYIKEMAPSIHPIAAETTKTMDIQGVQVLLITDLVHQPENSNLQTVVDYKTAKRMKSANEAQGSLQLNLNCLAWDLENAAFVVLTKAKTPKVKSVPMVSTKKDKKWAITVVKEVDKAIRTGSFPPCAPDCWNCSENMCGYYHRCRGK